MQEDGEEAQMVLWTRRVDPAERDIWEERLASGAMPGLVLEESVGEPGLVAVGYGLRRETAEAWQADFGGEMAPLPERDWVAFAMGAHRGAWLEIGERFVVAWDESEAFRRDLGERYPGRECLVVPPEMAFGTGDHETTAACLEIVEGFAVERGGGWSMLDLGTGTGILAMAAARLGAGLVVGTEVDETALRVARRNLERNGLAGGRVALRLEDARTWQPAERFDLVCANLYAEILREVIPMLGGALRPGGHVCLSGILEEQTAPVVEALGGNGFVIRRQLERGKWRAVLASRADSAD